MLSQQKDCLTPLSSKARPTPGSKLARMPRTTLIPRTATNMEEVEGVVEGAVEVAVEAAEYLQATRANPTRATAIQPTTPSSREGNSSATTTISVENVMAAVGGNTSAHSEGRRGRTACRPTPPIYIMKAELIVVSCYYYY